MSLPLRQLPVLVVDGQTTGASPAHGYLLELGWAQARADDGLEGLDVCSCLLTIPEGAEIPRPVSRLTGIVPEMLVDAESPERAWFALQEAMDGEPSTMVIHYARFELPFLRELVSRGAEPEARLPWPVVCTHEIARRLLPQLPRRGLRALAGYFGHGIDALKRSAEHVRATAFVWCHLVERLESEHQVTTLDELDAWLRRPAPKPSAKRAYPMDRATRLALPDAPGVYRMRRASGELLYVGKARSLHARVNGYFRQHRGVPEKTLEMLTQARRLDVTVTASALEAALLEHDEIKAREPPYNVMLRGDGRTVWHASSDLSQWSEVPTRRHRRGPFGSRTVLEAWRALASASFEPLTIGIVIGTEDGPEPAIWRQGLELFRCRWGHGDAHLDSRSLGRVGAHIWRSWRESADEHVDASDEPAQSPEELEWDPERVARMLERVVRLGAHEYRRAAWITRLVECSVAWVRPDGRMRALVVEAGRVTDRLDRDPPGSLPVPPGWSRSLRHRRSAVDLATFDRIRVLTAEVRRVLADGRDAWLRLGPGAPLGPRRLRAALWWI